MKVITTREVLMCVHGVSVTECPMCQEEMRNGHDVPARPVTIAAEAVEIQVMPGEEE